MRTLVTDNFDRLRNCNFGVRELHRAHDPRWLHRSGDARQARWRVSARVREEAVSGTPSNAC
jgi:hypothetical protein